MQADNRLMPYTTEYYDRHLDKTHTLRVKMNKKRIGSFLLAMILVPTVAGCSISAKKSAVREHAIIAEESTKSDLDLIKELINDHKAEFEPTETEYYTVKWGDTLWDLAKSHDMTVDKIVKMNPGIKNPNKIHPGDRLVLSRPISDIDKEIRSLELYLCHYVMSESSANKIAMGELEAPIEQKMFLYSTMYGNPKDPITIDPNSLNGIISKAQSVFYGSEVEPTEAMKVTYRDTLLSITPVVDTINLSGSPCATYSQFLEEFQTVIGIKTNDSGDKSFS